MQRLGLLKRRQVLALEVLDEREFDYLGIVDVAHDGRKLPEADLNGGLIPALASDNLKAIATLPHDQRLENPLLADGRDQLGQVAHDLPRLIGIGIDLIDRNESADG